MHLHELILQIKISYDSSGQGQLIKSTKGHIYTPYPNCNGNGDLNKRPTKIGHRWMIESKHYGAQFLIQIPDSMAV